jgi:hypothetical protein
MSFLNASPDALATAAGDLTNIREAVNDATAFASRSATGILPAGADEVSAAITSLFNSHAQTFNALAAQGESFHKQFASLLSGAGNTYKGTEQAALQSLRDAVTQAEQPFLPVLTQALGSFGFGTGQLPTPPLPTAPPGQPVALLVGGTGYPVLGGWFPGVIQQLYFPSIMNYGSIFTPEQLWPITPWLGGQTLGQSVANGVPLLNAAINTELARGNPVTVWGTSQGSTVADLEIRSLMAQGSPNANQLSFILTGNPENPNGGILERFVGAYIPVLDLYGYGATPPNAPYHITMVTNEYDGVSDFPQYPLNLVSDLNAGAGFLLGGDHDYAPYPTAGTVQLPTSPGYTGNTTYLFNLEQNVPLLTPLRQYLPAPYGNAFADLLQPDVRVIVDMGYGTGEYANIPTPASLFELPDPFTILPDLATGTIQGPQAFLHDLGFPVNMPTGYPMDPELNPDLNFPLPQISTTGLSLLLGAEGDATKLLGLEPGWD